MPDPDSAGGCRVELIAVTKRFDGRPMLHDISLTIAAGEFISLVGPSGCGKTTTLNLIAGFVSPDAGDIRLGERSVLSVPPHQRDLGMVFQNHALFPHLTVAGNVGFGLLMRKLPREQIRRRVGEALDMVRLADLSARYPRELSGGQQQRVGLARALTVKPQLILMDEPLSSLDAKLRREMQIEIRRIQRLVNTTAIYVTHDQEEALTLSDRIVLMNHGRIEQVGTPEAVYRRPVSEFAAGFIGEASFLDGIVRDDSGPLMVVEIAGAGFIEAATCSPVRAGAPVRLAVRPDRVGISADFAGAGPILAGILLTRTFVGANHRCLVDLGRGRIVQAHVPADEQMPADEGDRVAVRVAGTDWLLLGATCP